MNTAYYIQRLHWSPQTAIQYQVSIGAILAKLGSKHFNKMYKKNCNLLYKDETVLELNLAIAVPLEVYEREKK